MYVKDGDIYESREDYLLDVGRRISNRRAEQYQQVGLIEVKEAIAAAYSAVHRRMNQMLYAAKDAARHQAEAQGLGRRTTQAAVKAAVYEVENSKAYRKLMDVRRALGYARTHLSDAFDQLVWEHRKATREE